MVSPGGKQIEPGTTGGDWRQNDWKVKHSKQGTPSLGQLIASDGSSLPHRAMHGWGDTRMEVRVPVGALKRLTPVEQRGTGRWIEKGQTFGKQTRLNSAAEQSGVA